MKIEFDESDVLVRWRRKAGHMEDGQFIVDDLPNERTGSYGVIHLAAGDGKTVCGKPIPADVEEMQFANDSLCALCIARSR